ncbi:MAG: GTPase ObgE [Opitutales bacterium]
MFFDEVTITLEAGDGGDGCFSMRRARFVPKGGPDGGNGGRGGNVIIECDENVGDLRAFHFRKIWKAPNGEPGRGRDQHGAKGEDLLLKLPPGTEIQDRETGRVLAQTLEHGKRFRFLRGGEGGLGNASFKSAVNQAPRQTTPGEEGQAGTFRLVMKTIADIGLVGYPNAGKSTLLAHLTAARPKTAAYPFTTVTPMVGIVDYPEHYSRLSIADIPGLIEGASRDRGLGHRFLRHIERCRLLVFLIDLQGTDGREPGDDLTVLRGELEAYGSGLAEKPYLVVANKMDEPDATENLTAFRGAHPGVDVLPLSCLSEEGLPELKATLWERMRHLKAASEVEG